MRLSVLVPVVAALWPASVAAQTPFEGVITFARTAKEEHSEMTVRVKGGRVRLETDFGEGPMVLIQGEDGRTISVMMAARRYLVMPRMTGTDPLPHFTATGKHETIAGLECQYYRQAETSAFWGTAGDVCVTKALGFLAIGVGGGRIEAADAKALRAQFGTGFFILKKVDAGGGASIQVTKIERTSVSDAMFAPPAGFTEMKMPGRPGA
jgi:uncharacterized protein DUF4412